MLCFVTAQVNYSQVTTSALPLGWGDCLQASPAPIITHPLLKKSLPLAACQFPLFAAALLEAAEQVDPTRMP